MVNKDTVAFFDEHDHKFYDPEYNTTKLQRLLVERGEVCNVRVWSYLNEKQNFQRDTGCSLEHAGRAEMAKQVLHAYCRVGHATACRIVRLARHWQVRPFDNAGAADIRVDSP
jgi:predicted NAD/FAD-binding protein